MATELCSHLVGLDEDYPGGCVPQVIGLLFVRILREGELG